MSNAILGCPNHLDKATLSGGSWRAAAPLAHLQEREYALTCRSTTTSVEDATIIVTLPVPMYLRVLAAVAHNFTANGLMRVTVYDAADAILHQSAWKSVWPPLNLQMLEWEWDQFWTGDMPPEQATKFPGNSVYVLPTRVLAKKVKFEFNDTGNAMGWLEMGRLFVADGFETVVNLNYGRKLGYASRSTVTETLAGQEFYDKRRPVRLMSGQFHRLKEEESDAFLQLQAELDVVNEVYYIENPANEQSYLLRAFPARLRELTQVECPSFENNVVNLELRELIASVRRSPPAA